MPKQALQNLMSELHEVFGSTEPSAEQQQLLETLERHVHGLNLDEPIDPTPLETAEILLAELEHEHPKTAAILNELLSTLRRL